MHGAWCIFEVHVVPLDSGCAFWSHFKSFHIVVDVAANDNCWLRKVPTLPVLATIDTRVRRLASGQIARWSGLEDESERELEKEVEGGDLCGSSTVNPATLPKDHIIGCFESQPIHFGKKRKNAKMMRFLFCMFASNIYIYS